MIIHSDYRMGAGTEYSTDEVATVTTGSEYIKEDWKWICRKEKQNEL
jgi:hypothetical protein